MADYCPDCLEAAALDPSFTPWAVAHGLAFDLAHAWDKSGAYYWTAERIDLVRCDPPRLATGERCEPAHAVALAVVRDVLAVKACRYYAAYLDGVPPDNPRAVRSCACIKTD